MRVGSVQDVHFQATAAAPYLLRDATKRSKIASELSLPVVPVLNRKLVDSRIEDFQRSLAPDLLDQRLDEGKENAPLDLSLLQVADSDFVISGHEGFTWTSMSKPYTDFFIPSCLQ